MFSVGKTLLWAQATSYHKALIAHFLQKNTNV